MEIFVRVPKLIPHNQSPTVEEGIPIRILNKIILVGTVSLQHDRQYTCNVKLKRLRVTFIVVENQYVALVIPHAKHMRLIILSSVACRSVPHSFTLSHEQHFSGKGYREENTCFDFLCSFCLKHFSL